MLLKRVNIFQKTQVNFIIFVSDTIFFNNSTAEIIF